jgi:allantoinase
MIVSDHSPSTPELKFAGDGDFAVAWGGISSLELGLPLIWTEASRRGHSLPRVVEWMASAPARVVGVPGKGSISVGADADFAVFAPEETFVVDTATLHHRHPISPYQGRTLQGVVRRTYLRGRPVDLDGPPQGRLRETPVHRRGRANSLPPTATDAVAAAEAAAAVSTTGFVGA